MVLYPTIVVFLLFSIVLPGYHQNHQVKASSIHVFKASLSSLSPSASVFAPPDVTGEVVVFIEPDVVRRVAYAGYSTVTGLDSNTVCTQGNDCGVHIHSGYSCFNTTLQEGHLFVDPVTTDPWTDERYTTEEDGDVVRFQGILDMGTNDVDGRAFVVHAQDGSRIACGILVEVTDDSFTAKTEPLSDSNVLAEVNVLPGFGATMTEECFYGFARNLEPGLESFLVGGPNCTSTNGCGTHIHSGTSCANTTTQGGHYYNAELVELDPWAIVGYETTDDAGNGAFVGCVTTGESEFDGRPFVVHANDGSRVSCGLLNPSCPAVSFWLWNVQANEPIGPLGNQIDLCIYGDTSLTIEAIASCTEKARIKLFDGSGQLLIGGVDKAAPFALGDMDRDTAGPVSYLNIPGKYKLKVNPTPGHIARTKFKVGYFSCDS